MTVPFALSVHNFVNSVGAYVGLGSIVAVALLILLYFAHARETATLRERLDEAQQRISGLEGRLAQLMQSQGAARRVPGPVRPPVTPVPPPVRPGAAAPAAKRASGPATAAGVATAAPAVGLAAAAANRNSTSVPSAPAGTGAPALASATKVIPDPAGAGSGAPDDTIFVPAAAAAAATAATNGQGGAAHGQAVSAATQAVPAAATAARTPSASPAGATAAPPRMQLDTAEPATHAAASGGASRVRRIGGNNPPVAPVLPSFDEPAGGRGRLAGRVLPLLIGVLALAVIIVGLLVITNAGGSNPGQSGNTNNGQTGAGLHKHQTTPVAFKPAHVTVAVLNGTAQAGLAGDVGNKLVSKGYKKGNITNAASQTQGQTLVYYAPGRRATVNKVAARHVALALKLSLTRVHRASRGVLQACAISASGATLGTCRANVIVSVGQDRVNLATGG